MTLVNAVFDAGIDGSVANTFAGYIISAAICGAVLATLACRRIENDGEEKREFLEFTADKEPTAETLRDFTKTRNSIKRNLIATAAALVVILFYTYGARIVVYPIYTLLFLLDFRSCSVLARGRNSEAEIASCANGTRRDCTNKK